MPHDKSADKRYQLAQAIMMRERQIDQVNAERRRMQAALDNYETEMHARLEHTRELHEEHMARGGIYLHRDDMEQDAAREQLIESTTQAYREQAQTVFAHTLRRTESDIDDLQQQRDNLPWD